MYVNNVIESESVFLDIFFLASLLSRIKSPVAIEREVRGCGGVSEKSC